MLSSKELIKHLLEQNLQETMVETGKSKDDLILNKGDQEMDLENQDYFNNETLKNV